MPTSVIQILPVIGVMDMAATTPADPSFDPQLDPIATLIINASASSLEPTTEFSAPAQSLRHDPLSQDRSHELDVSGAPAERVAAADGDPFAALDTLELSELRAASGDQSWFTSIRADAVSASSQTANTEGNTFSNTNNGYIGTTTVTDNSGFTTVFQNTGNGVTFQNNLQVNVVYGAQE